MASQQVEQAARNLAMFGVEDIEATVEDMKASILFRIKGVAGVTVSTLSDVQEMIAAGQVEKARQTLNVVKYIIMEAGEGTIPFKVSTPVEF